MANKRRWKEDESNMKKVTRASGHHLKLVYSRDLQDSSIDMVDPKYDVLEQLELFPSSLKKDLLLFTQPKDSIFEFLAEQFNNNWVKCVIDIREAPYLSFNDISRTMFFDMLSAHGVLYINVHSFMRKMHAQTVTQFFDLFETTSLAAAVDTLKEYLQPAIQNGPTIVFTDVAPEHDEIASKFASSLRKLNIKYSPYIWRMNQYGHRLQPLFSSSSHRTSWVW